MILIHPINSFLIKTTSTQGDFSNDVQAINKIPIIPQLLDVICRTTGMRFSAIARITEDRWITCTTKDSISFGLKPGDELKVETTLCHEVPQNETPVFIDHADDDPVFKAHHTPKIYGIQSYISVPVFRKDGSLFGTLFDQERIGQLFSNLLSNADTRGAEESPIYVEATSNEKEFRLSATNGGDKIPESAMKHLFQPFYREDLKPGEQGLGLYITSEIARAHGGKVEVRSTDDETCFTFSMPSK